MASDGSHGCQQLRLYYVAGLDISVGCQNIGNLTKLRSLWVEN